MNMKELVKNPGTTIVDVRSVLEYQSGHVEGAVNIPLDQLPARAGEIEGLGVNPVIFYCRSGARSGMAVSLMQQQGVKNIYNGGGLDGMLLMMN